MTKRLIASLLFAQSTFAFNLISFDGQPTRWPKTDISYVVDSAGSVDFRSGCDSSGTCESERSAIQKAFNSWSGVPGVNLTFRESAPQTIGSTGYDGRNSVIFINHDWTKQNYHPPTGALAVTITTYNLSNAQILDADIHFNGEYFNWGVVNSDSERRSGRVVDIQNVATHEIGHFLGLGHSSENYAEPNRDLYMATMFFASGPGETFRRDLKSDDISAIKHLYPEGAQSKPAVSSITPKDIDARSTAVATIELSGSNFSDTVSVSIARKGERGDTIGKIVSKSEGHMEVAFETYGLGTGKFDLVVANTVDSQQRLTGALSVVGYVDEEDTGQYGSLNSDGSGCAANGAGSAVTFFLMVGLPILLIFPGRLQGVRAKERNPRRYRKVRF